MKKMYLYGPVVGNRQPWYDEYKVSYICPQIVQEELDGMNGEDVTLYMNTQGGDVYAGVTIRHMLERYEGKVTAVIDGIGASAGSLILMGADEVHMHNDSTFMLHFPWTFAVGNSRDLRKVADRLETLNGLMMSAYRERFTGEEDDLRKLLENESELTAEQALDYGFCDVLVDKEKLDAMAQDTLFPKAEGVENQETPEPEEPEEPKEKPVEEGTNEPEEPKEPVHENETEEKTEGDSVPNALLARFAKKENNLLQKFKKMEDEE